MRTDVAQEPQVAAMLERAQHRIRVNAICPGIVVTPLIDRGQPERAAARAQGLQPWAVPPQERHRSRESEP